MNRFPPSFRTLSLGLLLGLFAVALLAATFSLAVGVWSLLRSDQALQLVGSGPF